MRFFDVFWRKSKLKSREKMAYKEYGAEKLKELAKSFNDYLQILNYKCSDCRQKSRLNDFHGSIFSTFCPQCGEGFTPRSIGEDFLTNIYLRQL